MPMLIVEEKSDIIFYTNTSSSICLTRSSSSTQMSHMASCFSNRSCSSNTRASSARLTPTVGRSGVSLDAKSPQHSSTTITTNSSLRVRPIALADVAVDPASLGRKQAMEMTEYGKHGKPRSRLPTLPTLFGNPFVIPTFPRPRRLDSCLLIPAQLEIMAAARGL